MKGKMKKGEVFSKTAATVLIFILVGGAILLVFTSFYSDFGAEPDFRPTVIFFDDGGQDECISGSRTPCTAYSGCPGEKICLHGSWSTCSAYSECTPGDERFCPTRTCNSGVQTCNECGQWGRCTIP